MRIGKVFEDVPKQFGIDVDDWHPSGRGGLKDELKKKLFNGEDGKKLKKLYGNNPDFGLDGDKILIRPTTGVKEGKHFDTGLKKSDLKIE